MLKLDEGGTIMQSINPANYRVNGEVAMSMRGEICSKVLKARSAAKLWRDLGVPARVHILRAALAEFENRKDEVASLESREMGKPITAAASDFNDALAFANWYLDNAEACLAPETTFENDSEIHQVFRAPLGVAAVILPWNYPFLMFVWTAIPNLIAGNTVVLKHSEEVPLCGKLIEEVMTGILPEGVLSEVYGDYSAGMVLTQQDVDIICFTGSGKTGKLLYEAAGKKFIRSVMELGGSAPGIVFGDADLDAAVKSIQMFRLSNAGQYCDGLKRLIVHRSVFQATVDKLTAAFAAVKVGSPEDPATEMGPLVAKRQLDLLIQQVADARLKGANVISAVLGEAELDGAFYPPTLLTNVDPTMHVWSEEVFGPVLPIVVFDTEEEAIRLANGTKYGLGGYVYTADLAKAARVAEALETGMVSVNGTNYTTPFNPFGGWKHSGIGREHGKWGFHELTQVKVVAKPK